MTWVWRGRTGGAGAWGGLKLALGVAAWCASTAAARAESITYDAVLAGAEDDPQVVAAIARVDAAQAEAKAELAWENPQFRVAVNDLGRMAVTDLGLARVKPWVEVGLRVPVPNPVLLLRARAEGAASVALAEAERERVRLAVRRELAALYVDAWASSELALAHRRMVDTQRALVEHARKRREAGLASSLELARALGDLGRAEVAAGEAAANAAAAIAVLQNRLAMRTTPELAVVPAPPVPASLEDAVGARVQAAGLAELSRGLTGVGESTARVEASTAIPWFDWVQVSAELQPREARADLSSAIRLPLWAWGTAAAKAARLDASADVAEVVALHRELAAETAAAWSLWSGAERASVTLAPIVADLRRERDLADASLRPAIDVELARLELQQAELLAVRSVAGWAVVAR
jgi:hypothetical protein